MCQSHTSFAVPALILSVKRQGDIAMEPTITMNPNFKSFYEHLPDGTMIPMYVAADESAPLPETATEGKQGVNAVEPVASIKDDHSSLRETLEATLRHLYDVTCAHENTHRGGAIWTICDDCGQKWSDDRNPKPENTWPDIIPRLEAELEALKVNTSR